MRIAVVLPPWIPIPPKNYGGIESVAQLLVDGLVGRGHDVTVFTVGESTTNASKSSLFETGQLDYLDAPPSPFLSTSIANVLHAYKQIDVGDFDVVADHTWKDGLLCAEFIDTPVVHTLHGTSYSPHDVFFEQLGDANTSFVSISQYQRSTYPMLQVEHVVYNGLDLDRYPFSLEKEDFYFFLGRFCPEKSPHIACEVANKLGVKLYMAGKLNEPAEREYFDEYVKPQLSDNVSYVGSVGSYSEEKMEYLSKAKALLNPIQWNEPFGIVMAEAQACGTPVITYDFGSASELVKHGETGFTVTEQHEFVEAVEAAELLDPMDCRSNVEANFSAEAMVTAYEEIYSNTQ